MAKFCTGCGAQLDEAAKFCTSCGQTLTQPLPAPAQQMQLPGQYPPPMPAKKKSRAPMIIGGVAVLAVLIVIVAVLGKGGGGGTEHGGGHSDRPTSDDSTLLGGEDAVSVNALAGSWFYYDGWGSAYLWRFDLDGNYVRFIVSQSGYTNDVGTTWYSAYGNVMTGKYRVNGHLIECYNNQHSSQFARDYSIGSVPPHNIAVSQLPPLSDPSKVEDITLEFEFTDTMTLRLVTFARPLYDDYDTEFEYFSGDSHNVTIPTHSIPPREWPEVYAKVGIPAYGDGRVRYAGNRRNGDRISEVNVSIDHTSQAYFNSFIERLMQSGWEIESDYGIDTTYEKDGYNLTVTSLTEDENGGYTAFRRIIRITLWTSWGSGRDIDDLFK